MRNALDNALYAKIYEVVQQVPFAMVTTYGDVATIVGGGCDARTVGYALNEVPAELSTTVPWQRVVNREGGISTRGLRQRQLLESEGVAFDLEDQVIMARHRWEGPTAEWATAHACFILPPRDEGDRAEQLSLF